MHSGRYRFHDKVIYKVYETLSMCDNTHLVSHMCAPVRDCTLSEYAKRRSLHAGIREHFLLPLCFPLASAAICKAIEPVYEWEQSRSITLSERDKIWVDRG
jgi:hypothetical protein